MNEKNMIALTAETYEMAIQLDNLLLEAEECQKQKRAEAVKHE